MSIYYNFYYLDLDKVKSPYSDDGQFYLLENQESYEYLSNPILFKTMNNHFIRECFNKVNELEVDFKLVETLKYVFGNMFWAEIQLVENRKFQFHLNYWKLERYQIGNNDYGGRLDWYSIHQEDIKTILNTIEKINIEEYFDLATHINQLNSEKDKLNRTIIQEWIKMYQTAVEKDKGIVYDIG
jgi:hypothetical protein